MNDEELIRRQEQLQREANEVLEDWTFDNVNRAQQKLSRANTLTTEQSSRNQGEVADC